MSQMAFYFNGRRCTGCKTCEFACKDYHNLPSSYTYRRVYEYEGGGWETDAEGFEVPSLFSYFVSAACNHCDNPACVAACAAGAVAKDPETGLVAVDADACVGCGACATACPYGAVTLVGADGVAESGMAAGGACVAAKCDGCAGRVAAGQAPVCVEACPMRALAFGAAEELAQRGERANVAPLPSSDETQPNLYVTPSRHAVAAGSSEGRIGNPEEL